MRILLLTILFIGGLSYIFPRGERAPSSARIDSVKLKLGAPERTPPGPEVLEKKTELPVKEELPPPTYTEDEGELSATSNENEGEGPEQSIQWSELEEGWNSELKTVLLKLEPREGELIHSTYLAEKEAYQTELQALLNEKQQTESPSESGELDQLMSQLDYNHQEKLKEIFGVHYESIRDYYDEFMQTAPGEAYSE